MSFFLVSHSAFPLVIVSSVLSILAEYFATTCLQNRVSLIVFHIQVDVIEVRVYQLVLLQLTQLVEELVQSYLEEVPLFLVVCFQKALVIHEFMDAGCHYTLGSVYINH